MAKTRQVSKEMVIFPEVVVPHVGGKQKKSEPFRKSCSALRSEKEAAFFLRDSHGWDPRPLSTYLLPITVSVLHLFYIPIAIIGGIAREILYVNVCTTKGGRMRQAGSEYHS